MSIGGAPIAVQKAIWDRLRHLTWPDDLTTLVAGRVYDGVRRNATFPYVVVRNAETEDQSTGSTDDFGHTVTIDVWSRAGPQSLEARRILAAVYDRLLDFQDTYDGHIIVDCHFLGDLIFQEEDETRHGVARYSVLSEPA